jgi:hypothetical protein
VLVVDERTDEILAPGLIGDAFDCHLRSSIRCDFTDEAAVEGSREQPPIRPRADAARTRIRCRNVVFADSAHRCRDGVSELFTLDAFGTAHRPIAATKETMKPALAAARKRHAHLLAQKRFEERIAGERISPRPHELTG